MSTPSTYARNVSRFVLMVMRSKNYVQPCVNLTWIRQDYTRREKSEHGLSLQYRGLVSLDSGVHQSRKIALICVIGG